jgi:hypothetical protein
MHTLVEDIYTDQYLHLQATVPIDDPLECRGSGKVVFNGTNGMPLGLGFCGAQFVFGFVKSDVLTSVPSVMLSSDDLAISENELGLAITATSEQGAFEVSLSRTSLAPSVVILRQTSGEVLEFSDIGWDLNSDPPMPIAYTTDRDLRIRIVTYDLNANIDEAELLPVSDFPDGSFVRVSDLPVDCEWRDGRIVPRVVVLETDGTSSVLSRSSIRRVLIAGILGIALLAVGIWLHSRQQ